MLQYNGIAGQARNDDLVVFYGYYALWGLKTANIKIKSTCKIKSVEYSCILLWYKRILKFIVYKGKQVRFKSAILLLPYVVLFMLFVGYVWFINFEDRKNYEYYVDLSTKKLIKVVELIYIFNDKEKRLPKDLDELMSKGIATELPELPNEFYCLSVKGDYSYKILTGNEFQSFELKTNVAMGLSADIAIYYFPEISETMKLMPTDDWEWNNRYKYKTRFDKNWVYCWGNLPKNNQDL